MKGRGSPQQGRGRGYFSGRGGRGSPAMPSHHPGNIPTIGAYLDLPPGKDIAHGSVTKWMAKMKEYAMTTFKSRVSMIFGADGTLGDYPVYVLPDQPAEDATVYDRKIWEIQMVDYTKNVKTLDEDKGNLYGAMLGQMSESSKTRASEVQTGVEVENEFEPRNLMQAILATHIGDSTIGVQHQIYMITQRYNNLIMGQHDNLSMYYINTKSALTAIQQAYKMALKLILGLNSNYGEFKSFFTNGLKPWPDCLETAYQEVLWRERNEPTLSLRWPKGSMKATLPLFIRSLQKEVDLPAFEPDLTQDSNQSSLGPNTDALPALSTG